MMLHLKMNWLVVSKVKWGIWRILTRALESPKNCTGFFWPKYKMFELKKYRGVSFMTLKSDAKFEKISPEHLGLWWDSFIQSRKCMSLKFKKEFCVMTTRNDTKFEGRLKNSDFILAKFKTTRSTRRSVKTLFQLGNKWLAQLTKRFTHVPQNRCS